MIPNTGGRTDTVQYYNEWLLNRFREGDVIKPSRQMSLLDKKFFADNQISLPIFAPSKYIGDK